RPRITVSVDGGARLAGLPPAAESRSHRPRATNRLQLPPSSIPTREPDSVPADPIRPRGRAIIQYCAISSNARRQDFNRLNVNKIKLSFRRLYETKFIFNADGSNTCHTGFNCRTPGARAAAAIIVPRRTRPRRGVETP